MAGKVSAADKDYMRRLGEFKEAANREALERHRALTVNERLEASLRLTRRGPYFSPAHEDNEDLAAFFARAKRLGLYKG
ncbi:MAG: hypothetical protein AB7N24_16930 [Dehalococcoidia bacterium]